jgi:protein-tyrosine-phosphatase
MAEEFFNALAGGKATAESAGTAPGDNVNPVVAEAMAELGFDLSRKKPRLLTPEMIAAADKVITMGCMKDEGVCPVTFTPAEDWGLPDPKGQDLATVREIRDEIKRRVAELVERL